MAATTPPSATIARPPTTSPDPTDKASFQDFAKKAEKIIEHRILANTSIGNCFSPVVDTNLKFLDPARVVALGMSFLKLAEVSSFGAAHALNSCGEMLDLGFRTAGISLVGGVVRVAFLIASAVARAAIFVGFAITGAAITAALTLAVLSLAASVGAVVGSVYLLGKYVLLPLCQLILALLKHLSGYTAYQQGKKIAELEEQVKKLTAEYTPAETEDGATDEEPSATATDLAESSFVTTNPHSNSTTPHAAVTTTTTTTPVVISSSSLSSSPRIVTAKHPPDADGSAGGTALIPHDSAIGSTATANITVV